jgi:hypothetical protein
LWEYSIAYLELSRVVVVVAVVVGMTMPVMDVTTVREEEGGGRGGHAHDGHRRLLRSGLCM